MGMQYSRGLVAGYPFENTGADIMGVNNGTVNGAVFVDGQCGRALSFDGVDDYVTLPVGVREQLSGASAITFSAWIKPQNKSLNTIFNTGTISIGNTALLIRIDSFNNFYTLTRSSNTDQAKVVQKAYTFSDDWYYIAVVVNYGTENVKLYVNAVEIHSQNVRYALTSLITGSGVSYFGIQAVPNVWSYSGLIDQVQIYNKAANINEIKKLYLNLGI